MSTWKEVIQSGVEDQEILNCEMKASSGCAENHQTKASSALDDNTVHKICSCKLFEVILIIYGLTEKRSFQIIFAYWTVSRTSLLTKIV